jgi:hypothetical protein
MPTPPAWVLSALIAFILGAIGSGYVFISVFPGQPNPSNPMPSPFPSTSTPNQEMETVKIIVRDSKSDLTLSGVEVEIQTKETVINDKTVEDGTLTTQIPRQVLGEIYISLRLQDYKQITRKPINLSVEPNKLRPFYLEPSVKDGTNGDASTDFEPKAIINTKKTIYAEGEPIQVDYSGFPGKYQDLITLVNSSVSEKQWNQGEVRRNISTKGEITYDGFPPGNYEIRAYYNYKEGNYYKLIGRHPIEVK